MNVSREKRLKLVVELSEMGLMLAGVCLLGIGGVVFGLGLFLFMEEPQRLAVRTLPENGSSDVVRRTGEVVQPRPQMVSPADTNVVLLNPKSAGRYFFGVSSTAAVWANGKPFETGLGAAWELLLDAWRLWLLGVLIIASSRLLNRFRFRPPSQPGRDVPT